MDVYVYMHANMQACKHVCMYASMHLCIYACIHICMYACKHLCMNACIVYMLYGGHSKVFVQNIQGDASIPMNIGGHHAVWSQ